jgi:hypothetical protein
MGLQTHSIHYSRVHPNCLHWTSWFSRQNPREMRCRGVFEEEMKTYNGLLNCLQDHTLIIAVFKKALSSYGWPKDDAADPQDFLRCNEVLAGMRSGSNRSRSVVEGNDDLLQPPVPKQLSS